ncbi:hypothetical protein [Streptomyces sp. NPDC048419]
MSQEPRQPHLEGPVRPPLADRRQGLAQPGGAVESPRSSRRRA